MTRRLLLVSGGSAGGGDGGGGGVPSDPNLTARRSITAPLPLNINGTGTIATAGGITIQFAPIAVMEDSADLRLVWDGQPNDDIRFKAAVRKNNSGPWTPVLVDGVDQIVVTTTDKNVVSDPIVAAFFEGDTITVRTYVAEGDQAAIGGTGGLMVEGSDARFAATWEPTYDYPVGGPYPAIFEGLCRPSVVSVGVFGDSIANMAVWFQVAAAANNLPGAILGIPVQRFDSHRYLDHTLDGLTHLLVQFGVNDLNSNGVLPGLWDLAVEAYAYADSWHPGLLMWQSTATPIVGTTDACATLENQTFDHPTINARRQAWNAFLRDGAPCHPTTKAALAVGATGTVIRAGDDGHPLRGVVDIAAAVEQGGSSAPTGKWLPGDPENAIAGFGWGGDGVHPSIEGCVQMAIPNTAWMATLTT